MGLKLIKSKLLVMFPVFYHPNHKGAFLRSCLKKTLKQLFKVKCCACNIPSDQFALT